MSTIDPFEAAIQFTLKAEGGHVDDVDDPGGETIYGISRRAHPEAWAHGTPTQEDAIHLYRHDYWDKPHLAELAEHWPRLAVAVFDHAVNAGPSTAVALLQRMVDTSVDGVMGGLTFQAVAMRADRLLASAYLARRENFYTGLADTKPRLEKFRRGWLNRVANLRAYLNRWA